MELLIIISSCTELNGHIADVPVIAQTHRCTEIDLQKICEKIATKLMNKDIKYIHILKKINSNTYIPIFSAENESFKGFDTRVVIEKSFDLEITKKTSEDEQKENLI